MWLSHDGNGRSLLAQLEPPQLNLTSGNALQRPDVEHVFLLQHPGPGLQSSCFAGVEYGLHIGTSVRSQKAQLQDPSSRHFPGPP